MTVLQKRLEANGTRISRPSASTSPASYQITGDGLHLNARFDAALGTLEVMVIRAPFYISEDDIEAGLQHTMNPPAVAAAAAAAVAGTVEPVGEPAG